MSESPVSVTPLETDPTSSSSSSSSTVTNVKPFPTTTTDCHDSPTRVTNSNTSSETASLPDYDDDAVAVVHDNNDEQQQLQVLHAEQQQQATMMMLSSLARQLEFYFSPSNLPRDTYLQTLQSLNDGYVPLTIIANFAKVQAICSTGSSTGSSDHDGRLASIVNSVSKFSTVLHVVYISTVTNKRVDQENEHTILAIGPYRHHEGNDDYDDVDQPLPSFSFVPPVDEQTQQQQQQQQTLVPPITPIQNTIILRDVPDDVTKDDVQSLFAALSLSCPTHIQEVRHDVANCWFVTLDVSTREEMVSVMLELKKQTLKGETVKARLKAASTPTTNTVLVGAFDPNAIAFPAIHQSSSSLPSSPSRNNKKQSQGNNNNGKSKSRSRNRRKNNGSNKSNQRPSSPSTPRKQQQQQQQTSQQKQQQQPTAPPPPPPLLEEESHFPALPVATPSVMAVDNIVDKVGGSDAGLTSKAADGASTTTTTSSTCTASSTSVPPAPALAGGYAAALLKSAPPKVQTINFSGTKATAKSKNSEGLATNEASSEKSEAEERLIEKSEANTESARVEKKLEPREEIAPMPMSWGSGRSFAQVLKKEEESS